MSPLEAQRSTTLSSLSLNSLLGHGCGRNGTKLCLREFTSLRDPGEDRNLDHRPHQTSDPVPRRTTQRYQ